MRSILLLCLLALGLLTPASVEACGGTPPSFTLLTDAMGRVPAGTKVLKLYVYGSSIEPTPPKLSLSAQTGGAPVSIPVTLRVVAPWLLELDLGSAAVQAETSYALSVQGVESEGGNVRYSAQLSFEGVAAGPLPSQLGELLLEQRGSGTMIVGGCGDRVDGEHALIRLVPSAAAQPWVRAVKHQLYVDGLPAFEPEMPLVDHVARKMEPVVRAIAECQRSASSAEIPHALGIELRMSAGEHSVKWTSTFPDGSTLETPPLAVDLRCAASVPTPPCCKPLISPADAGAGVPLTSDAGLNVATPAHTGPGGVLDGGTAESAVPPAASLAGPAPAEDGCKLGRGHAGGAQALGLSILLFLLHARRARRWG